MRGGVCGRRRGILWLRLSPTFAPPNGTSLALATSLVNAKALASTFSRSFATAIIAAFPATIVAPIPTAVTSTVTCAISAAASFAIARSSTYATSSCGHHNVSSRTTQQPSEHTRPLRETLFGHYVRRRGSSPVHHPLVHWVRLR